MYLNVRADRAQQIWYYEFSETPVSDDNSRGAIELPPGFYETEQARQRLIFEVSESSFCYACPDGCTFYIQGVTFPLAIGWHAPDCWANQLNNSTSTPPTFNNRQPEPIP